MGLHSTDVFPEVLAHPQKIVKRRARGALLGALLKSCTTED
jgi:hypothetical protein